MRARIRFLALSLLSGCGGSPPPPASSQSATAAPAATTAAPEAEPDPFADARAEVRFLHLAVAASDKSLEAFAGPDTSMPLFPRVPFETATPYAGVAIGADGVALLVRGEGVPESNGSSRVGPGSHVTVAVLTADGGDAPLQLVSVPDDAPRPQGEAVPVRFFHAYAGAGSLDVCVAGDGPRAPATALFAGVEYGTFRPALELPSPLPVRISLRRASDDECTGRLVGVFDLSAEEGTSFSGQNLTLYAVGKTGRSAVAPAVFVSIDQPPMSGFATIPIRAR